MNRLEARNITYSYDNKVNVIENIQLSVGEGEIVCLLGVSGGGKTTLFNVISGLNRPQQGEILLDGEDITGVPGKISYMLQKDLLLPYRTIEANAALPLIIRGVKKKEAIAKVNPYFAEFGLEGTQKMYPSELSGGMRQRAALLRTYMASNSVALLDEPFSALDTLTKSEMHRWFLNVMEKIDLSILFITHDIDEAILISDRIYLLGGKPGTITDEIIINEPKPRRADFNLTDEFLQYKRQIISKRNTVQRVKWRPFLLAFCPSLLYNYQKNNYTGEENMLELKNLSFSVEENGKQKEILHDLNLKIDNSRFVVITGPNGSGKSTLAKLIMGIEKPTSGQIIFDGEDITELSITERAKRGISFAFQQPVRFKGIRVHDLLRLAAGKDISIAEACNYLSEVGLCARDYIEREINSSLSGGELKRIEIATLLARQTKLSVFDEPEAGIDLWSFQNLIRIFENMQKEIKDSSIIIISHQERILRIADEIVLLSGGTIKKQGSVEDILPELIGTTAAVDACERLK